MADLDNRNDRTLFVGNLEKSCKEEILYELFLQAGPLNEVKIAKERDGTHKGYAFIEFKHDISVPYARQLLNGTPIYGRQLSINFRKGSKHEQEPYQGPPVQAFPEGFPLPPGFGLPPDIQRTVHYPLPDAQFLGQNNLGGPPSDQRYRQSSSPHFQGHQGPSGGFQTGNMRNPYEDSRPSSRGPYRGTPPGSREQSPRWDEYNRGERHHGRAGAEHARSAERGYRERSGEQSSHHHHHQRRAGQDRPRDDGQHLGRERSRTVDDNQRGYYAGHQRDRSTEDYQRSRSGGQGGWSGEKKGRY